MAASASVVAVGTSATPLNTSSPSGGRLFISNQGAAAVFLGGSGVTTATGLSMGNGGTPPPILQIDLAPYEVVYGIVATGTVNVGVLKTGF